MTTKKQLLEFIKQARKRGCLDLQIKESLLNYGWSVKIIDNAFQSLMPKTKSKNQVCIFLSDDIISILSKRANKNLMSISEQVEDIVRRSCAKKTEKSEEKIDDLLISCFSRKKR
jgi:hypothetical protein